MTIAKNLGFLSYVITAGRFGKVLTLKTFFVRLVEGVIDWTDPTGPILGERGHETKHGLESSS